MAGLRFYECHIVRHSVMLVGMPFSGKTTALPLGITQFAYP